MKKIILTIGILLLSTLVYAENTVVIGSGLWTVEDGVGSAPDGVTLVDLPIDTPSAYMHEDNNGGAGTKYILSTAFSTWTSATSSDSTTGITVDESAGTITIGAGLDGRYVGTFHASFKAPSGKTITAGIFKNTSSVDDIVRSMAKGPERLPTFRSISSDDSSAVFGTQSSLSYLLASDGDDLIAIEAGTGSTGCSFLKVRYSEIGEPKKVVVETSAYQSNNSNHWMNARMLNYSTNAYVDLNTLAKNFEDVGATIEPYERVTWGFNVPSPLRNYVENGVSEVVFYHNDVSCSSSHSFHLDSTKIIDDYSSAVVAFPVEFSVVEGDVLTLQMKANEANVDLLVSDWGLNIFKIGL